MSYNQHSNEGVDDILKRINGLKNLADLPTEEIAKENGIAEVLAKNFKKNKELNTTQLRKFFDNIISNQERLKNSGWSAIESDFYMIRPNLAYAKGRKLIPDEFFKLVSICLQKVDTSDGDNKKVENYARFVELMQALVAYTKYYGVKEE